MSATQTFPLSMKNRFVLLGLLPPQGDFVTLRIVRELRERLAPSEQECAKLNIQTEGDKVKWDDKAENDDKPNISIGPRAFVLIQDSLKKLDEDKKLTLDHLPLYELFCPDPPSVV